MGQLDGEVVHHLVAHRTVDEHVEVEVLVTEGVVPSEGVFWHRRTNVRAVVLVNHTIAVEVFVLDVTYPNGVVSVELSVSRIFGGLGRCLDIFKRLIYTISDITIEVIQRLSYFRYRHHVAPLSVADDAGCRRAGETLQLVLVEGNLELCVPLEFTYERMCGESEFHTLVFYRTIVSVRCSES